MPAPFPTPAPIPVPTPTAAPLAPGQPGPLSGLAWHSGVGCVRAGFEDWRGHKIDTVTAWAPQTSWANLIKFSASLRSVGSQPMLYSMGLPMLTQETKGQFASCTSGVFDAAYTTVAQNLAAARLGNAVIRIGWEANGDWYPWSAIGQTETYKACFARIAGIFKSVSPDFQIEWTMDKRGRVLPVSQLYPGDDVVDIIGVDLYDRYPTMPTQAAWDRQLDRTLAGGPYGLGAWMSFARSHSKPLAVPEWGINNGYALGGTMGVAGDDANFVANMHAFFKANADNLAYENYFNCNQSNVGERYPLYPVLYSPFASATYQSVWSQDLGLVASSR